MLYAIAGLVWVLLATSLGLANNLLLMGVGAVGWLKRYLHRALLALAAILIVNIGAFTPSSQAQSLDGFGKGQSSTSSTVATSTTTLTTTLSPDIIYACVQYDRPSGATTISQITGGSLTFTQRATVTNSGTTNSTRHGKIDCWSAIASSTLSGVTLTATFASSIDDAAIIAFGVSGTNSTFDPNASIPTTIDTVNSAGGTGTISTTNARDFLIGAMGQTSGSPSFNPPTGWTTITTVNNTGGSFNAALGVAYNVVSTQQSSVGVTWSWGDNGIVDAATAGSRTPGGLLRKGKGS